MNDARRAVNVVLLAFVALSAVCRGDDVGEVDTSAARRVDRRTSAVGGDYGVGVGTASAVGAVHTANASTIYTVAAPVAGTLEGSVGTDRASYLRGQTVYMSARVVKSGVPVAGANVDFITTLPGGTTVLLNATTGADGYARATYKLGKSKAAVGAYALNANAVFSGSSVSAGTGFSVK